MISLKKSFVYKDLCYLMILWSVKLPMIATGNRTEHGLYDVFKVEHSSIFL